MGARGRHLGPDALASRAGLRARGTHGAACVLGRGRVAPQHAAPDCRGARVSDHDALVVGSGPNGLAAAITLARAGRDVLVLEAAGHHGGAVATEELTLPGFRHDTWSSVYPAAAASPVFESFELERHGLEWVHPRWCMAHVVGGGRAAALGRDVEETADTLDRLHPGDGEAWADFVRPYLRRFGAL